MKNINSDLLNTLDDLSRTRGIDRETLLTLVEESLLSAARKAMSKTREVTVHIDRKTGAIKCLAKLFVVHVVENPEEEISLDDVRNACPKRKSSQRSGCVCGRRTCPKAPTSAKDAKSGKTTQTPKADDDKRCPVEERYCEAQPGDEITWEVTPKDFGRIAAQTAKQVIMQRLRQVEKHNICEMFQEQLNQLVTGIVKRVDYGEVQVSFSAPDGSGSMAEGAIRREDRIPGEDYDEGDMITALLTEINADKPGPSLYVSRSHPDLVTRLFEREVSEIAEKLVEIKAVAREPGFRSKIAVASTEQRVDPVGACVGQRGIRVRTVVRELGGEKVDIILWDPDVATFVANALKPARLGKIEVDEERHTVRVEVPEDQLSLSIGKKGQNARLASKLTGWRIDIQPEAPPEDDKQEDFEERVRRAIEAMAKIEEIGPEAAEILVQSGINSLEGIIAAEAASISALPGMNAERAAAIIAAARDALG
ncbi:MAG: transcription termination/antitermination protein NusA [Lentisphaerae bacterium]|jgi:N utilization substance protein A|nr:transcription termination/antitermination protein NusA [Lentisphaerota bacterium]